MQPLIQKVTRLTIDHSYITLALFWTHPLYQNKYSNACLHSSDSDHLEAPHSSVLTLILTLLEPGAVFKGFTFHNWNESNTSTLKYDHARMTFLLTQGPLIYSLNTLKHSINRIYSVSYNFLRLDKLADVHWHVGHVSTPQAAHTRLRASRAVLGTRDCSDFGRQHHFISWAGTGPGLVVTLCFYFFLKFCPLLWIIGDYIDEWKHWSNIELSETNKTKANFLGYCLRITLNCSKIIQHKKWI